MVLSGLFGYPFGHVIYYCDLEEKAKELTDGEVVFLALEWIRSPVTACLFKLKKHAGTLGL